MCESGINGKWVYTPKEQLLMIFMSALVATIADRIVLSKAACLYKDSLPILPHHILANAFNEIHSHNDIQDPLIKSGHMQC